MRSTLPSTRRGSARPRSEATHPATIEHTVYFHLSKLLGGLLDPTRLSLLLLGTALLLCLIRRLPRLRRALAVVAVALLWVLSTGAVSSALSRVLESRHLRPPDLSRAPGAIVMLTGLTRHVSDSPSRYELTESSDRFVETVRLARKYPRARVVLSGGIASLRRGEGEPESRVLARLARQLGVSGARLLVEDRSRNTHENAVETKRLLDEKRVRGRLLLVTSALHMPRSVACFERVGLKVTPWPVDYQTGGYNLGAFLPSTSGLQRSRVVLHELVGGLVYSLMGYI